MTEPTAEEVVHRLRTIRQARGLRQADVAATMHISQSYVSMLETGDRPITLPLLESYAQTLGLRVTFDLSDLPAAS